MKEELAILSKIPREPGNLIQGLQLLQAAGGGLTDAAVRAAAEYFGKTEAEVTALAAFYPQFRRRKTAEYRIAVCDGGACRSRKSAYLTELLYAELGLRPGETGDDGKFSLETVPCQGHCQEAPVLSINGRIHPRMNREKLRNILRSCTGNEH